MQSWQLNSKQVFQFSEQQMKENQFTQKKKETQDNRQSDQEKQNQEKKQKMKEQQERIQRIRQIQKEESDRLQSEQLQQQVNKQSSNFSIASHLFQILKGKIIICGAFVLASYFGYQCYSLMEIHEDPITGQKKIILLKFEKEKKLARLSSNLFQKEYGVGKLDMEEQSQVHNNSYLSDKIVQLKEKYFQKLEQSLNLPIKKGDIFITEQNKGNRDFSFFILANGDIFASKDLLLSLGNDIKQQEEYLLYLMALEYSHMYLRSNINELSFYSLPFFLQFERNNYSLEFPRYGQGQLMKLRPIFQRQYSQKQQKNALICANDLLNYCGYEIQQGEEHLANKLKELQQILIKKQTNQNNINKEEKPIPLLRGDFLRRHSQLFE